MLIVIWRKWLPSVTVTGSCPRYAAWILMFTLLISTLTMDKCPTCTRHVSLHAKQIRCCVCQKNYHIKCLSLRAEDHAHIYSNCETWYCLKCFSEIFPFNQIDDDDMFVLEVNQLDVCTRTIESLTEILFNPFELSDDHYCPLNDVDPDLHFFNEFAYSHNGSCNYYFEQSLLQVLDKHFGTIFGHSALSLVHMNIRSLKANYLSFQTFVDNVGLDFSVIGLSETWLCDWNSKLYNIPGYNFIEAHRSSRKGGGVGMYLRDVIPFQHRNDLVMPDCNCECIFIEVDNDIFANSKNVIIGNYLMTLWENVNSAQEWGQMLLSDGRL